MKAALISAQTFLTQQAQGSCVVIDVRSPAEAANEGLTGSINLPLHDISNQTLQNCLTDNNQDDANHIYILCQSGQRARMAAEKLAELTSAKLTIIEGGINQLRQLGTPLESSSGGVISIERQVRITAGLLVVLGIALGTLVHPWYLGISAFVGAGLAFAGITDTCAMGMLLLRMPWNKA